MWSDGDKSSTSLPPSNTLLRAPNPRKYGDHPPTYLLLLVPSHYPALPGRAGPARTAKRLTTLLPTSLALYFLVGT